MAANNKRRTDDLIPILVVTSLIDHRDTQNIEWEIQDACRGVEKHMRAEPIYIKNQNSTRDQERGGN